MGRGVLSQGNAMQTFRDNAGTPWELSINVASMRRVRDVLGVNLGTIIDGRLMQQILDDPALLGDILYVLCKTQCDERKISDYDFGASLAGESIEAATNALLQELIDFFPPAKRAMLNQLRGLLRSAENNAVQLVMDRIVNPNPLTSGEPSTNAPESVA